MLKKNSTVQDLTGFIQSFLNWTAFHLTDRKEAVQKEYKMRSCTK